MLDDLYATECIFICFGKQRASMQLLRIHEAERNIIYGKRILVMEAHSHKSV
jgi:hypothetical protein